MSHKYYNSASAGATTPYESAATAGATLAVVLAAIGAVDEIIWVKNTSNEAQAASSTFTAPASYATPQKPLRLYSVSDFDASPGTLAQGAKLRVATSSATLTFAGNWDINGVDIDLNFFSGVLNLSFSDTSQDGNIRVSNSTFSLNSNASSGVTIGPGGATTLDSYIHNFENITISSGAAGQIPVKFGAGRATFTNLALTGTATTNVIDVVSAGGYMLAEIRDSDLTGTAWTNLIKSTAIGQLNLKLINCKLPSGVTIYAGTHPFIVVELIKTGNADVGYGYAKYQGGVGSIITDASVYATTDPMQDGGVSISNLFASASTCGRGFPLSRTYIIPCVADTAVTPFVEILVQGDGAAALNTDEIYITASTVTVDGTTKGTTVTSHPGLITAGSACSAGTTAYTGDGYTTERTHRIETAAITPRQNGYIEIEVFLAKPSTAIYVGQVGAA